MRIGRVAAAIKKRWDSMGLDSSFPGKLWRGRAPEGTRMPYVAMKVIDETAAVGRSSSSIFTNAELQFSIYLKPASGEDGEKMADALLEELDSCLNSAPLEIDPTRGQVLNFQWINDNVEDPDEGVIHAWSSYRVMAKRDVDFNPT